METTTPKRLRDASIPLIRAICPSHPEHQAQKWRYVEGRVEVPGPEIRNFTIEMAPGAPVFDGIYGAGGIEYELVMRVPTSYGHLAAQDDDSIITEDGRQVWLTIEAACPGGLISILHTGWEDENEDDGHRWGSHLYEMRYLASGTA